ncbi:hypothetical protein MTR67_018778 [Solanum verrucosum]|uniref:Uncharacterized protein n=1 Tax=Solanum verrucosum TaxID=315347 RepID=A0AAF0QLM4_SOLVR|nr:hypothetical protein MTR67_018778 [Solanum verrucosum]
MNSRTQNQLISRILKSRERILDYSFIDLKVDVGREDELVQHYDTLTYLKEQEWFGLNIKNIKVLHLSYEEVPVQILDRQVRKLRTKVITLVKVLWRNQFFEEATLAAEEDMMMRYPYLFASEEILNQGINPL